MESVGSNSDDPTHSGPTNGRRRRPQKPPAQALSERIGRALRHPLLLLHRSDSTFFVMGSTANVYTVSLTAAPTCTCPDRATPCKHILFVLIRVLGVPPDDPCPLLHHRRTLRPCQLSRLLSIPTAPDSLADPALRRRFHQIFFSPNRGGCGTSGHPTSPCVEVEDGVCCPVCLEEMGGRKKLVACWRCRNPVHEECLLRWKRSQGRRWVSCVICRARWRNATAAADKYLNLAAYRSEEEVRVVVSGVDGDPSGGCGGG